MRSWILLIALSAMLVLVAACGGDDDDSADDAATDSDTIEETEPAETEAPEATEEPEPTATSEPDPTEEPEPTAEPDPTATPEAEEAEGEEATEDATAEESDDTTADTESAGAGELDPLLLSLDDLPEGWTEVETEAIDVEDEDLADVSEEPFEAPCGIEPVDEAFEPVAEAEREFQGTELGPFFNQNLMQLESADDAAEAMNMMREIFGCEEWSEMDEFGEEITFTIEEVPFEDVGDDVFSIQLALSFDAEEASELDMFGEFDFEIVVVQRGEYLSMMMYFDLFGMSDADFESIVRSADEKIQSAS